MRARHLRYSCVAVLLSTVAFGSTGCDQDTQSSLISLTSATSGSLLQILVQDWLTEQASHGNPDLEAALADQTH